MTNHNSHIVRLGLFGLVLIFSGAAGCEGPEIEAVESPTFGAGNTDVGTYYRLRSVSSNLCIDVDGKSQNDGATVLQFTCGTGENQRWYFRALGANNYQVSAEHSA